MARELAKGLEESEILVMFNKFDANSDGRIDFNEFMKIMMYGISSNIAVFDFSGEKALNVIEDFKRLINDYKLDLDTVFFKFDVNWDNYLDRREFRDLIRVVDTRLSNDEINFLFDIFDRNQLNLISFQNLKDTLHPKLQPQSQQQSQTVYLR